MFARKTKMRSFLFGIIFGFFVLFVFVGQAVPVKAEIVSDPAHTAVTKIRGIVEQSFGKLNEYANTFTANITSKQWWVDQLEKRMLPILKQAAIQKINNMTTEVVTGGNSGGPYLVTDWNQYLVQGPANDAMVFVNSMLSDSMRGRSSAADYSNSGHSAYLLRQSQIKPSAPIDPVLVHATDPKNLFAGGDMRAFNEFLSPGKNQFSLSLIAEDAFQKKTEENRLVADKKAVNGYLPKVDALGKITTPAAFFENAMNSANNMGKDMVTSATKTDELLGAIVNFIVQVSMKPLTNGLISASSSSVVGAANVGVGAVNTGINVINDLDRKLNQPTDTTNTNTKQ